MILKPSLLWHKSSLRAVLKSGVLTLIFLKPIVTWPAISIANSSVTIISDTLAITKTADLIFGTIQSGSTQGTVTIGTDGVRSTTGGVTLSNTDVGHAASFDITTSSHGSFSISLPKRVTLTGPGASMRANKFTSSPSSITGNLNSNKKATLNIGATLGVSANQLPGDYSGTFNVIINAN